MNKKSLILTLFVAIAGVSVTILATSRDVNSFGFFGDDECFGYHYAKLEPTFDKSGHEEFWVCCKHQETYLTQPLTGQYIDQTDDKMVGGLTSKHIAYLPPLEHHYSNEWSYDENQHWHVCTDEGFESLTTEKTNHNFDEIVEGTLVPASYFAAGSKTVKCECGKTKDVIIPKLVPEETMTSMTTDGEVALSASVITNKKGINKVADGMWVIGDENGGDIKADKGASYIFTQGKIRTTGRFVLINLGAQAKVSFRVGASAQDKGVYLTLGIWNTTPNDAADNYMEGMTFNTKTGDQAASNNDYTVTLEAGLYAFGSLKGSIKLSKFTFEFHTPIAGNYGHDATNHWLAVDGCQTHFSEAAHSMPEQWTERTAATLEAPGEEYRTCTVCGYEETREIPQLVEGTFADTWSSDETQHWHECLDAGQSGKANGKDVADHTFVVGYDADGNYGERCSVCGYAKKTYTRTAAAIQGVCTQDTYVNSSSSTKDKSYSTTDKLRIYKSSNLRAYLGFDMSALVASDDYKGIGEDSYFEICFNVVGWHPNSNDIQNLTEDKMPTEFTLKAFTISNEVNNTSTEIDSLTWNGVTGSSYVWTNGKEISNTFSYTGIMVAGVVKAASVKILVKVADVSSYINANGYLAFGLTSNSNDMRLVAKENTNTNYGNCTEVINLLY